MTKVVAIGVGEGEGEGVGKVEAAAKTLVVEWPTSLKKEKLTLYEI